MADIIYTTFPDDFATNEEKESHDYGLKVGKAIDSQWFNGQLSLRRIWIDKMRAYARGEQTTDYRRMIEGVQPKGVKKGAMKHKNYKIDYNEKLRILPVFKDILTNAIDESNFKPRAEAIDITAVNKKKEFFKKLEEDFFTKDFADIISKGIGIDISPKNVPKDAKQLKIRKLEYKPRIEIAEELAIENVFKHQKFETIKDLVDEDLVDLGIGVAWHHTDYREGIKLKYVDPYNFVHSNFQIPDGRDLRYKGAAMKDTIGDLMKMADRALTEDELLALKRVALGNPDITEPYNDEDDSERLVEYVVFEYAVHKSRVFKKFKRSGKHLKAIDRTKTGYNPTNKNKKIDIPYKVNYEGIYVPSAQILLKWQEIPNQVEKEANNPVSNFVVYAPKIKRLTEKGSIRFDSLIQRAVPIIDDLHRDWYKFQQLKMELRPNTVTISPRALNRVVLNGQKIAPQDVLDLFFGRGILLADEVDEDGEPIGRAIREENGGVNNSAIVLLSNEFTNNYNRLRQLLGVNELRDGTTRPNSKTSVTVQKLLLASSNNATNHIVKGSFNISLRMAEVVSLRLYDVLTTKALKERYMNIIGSDNVSLLDAIKALPMHKFAIYFDFKPDNEERVAFENSLITSFNQGQINIAQYNRARQIRNTKSALKFLEFAVEENTQKIEEQKINNIERQAQANAQTGIAVEDKKQQTITIEFETKKQLLLLEKQLQDEADRKKAVTQDLLAQRAHLRKIELKQLESNTILDKETLKEDRKDARIDQQSSNQSKLIEQRKNNTGTVEFDGDSEITTNFADELDRVFDEGKLLPNQEV